MKKVNVKDLNKAARKMTYVTEHHGLQIFVKGMIFCCPDIMIASVHLNAIKRKIERVFTNKGKRHKFRNRYD